MAARCAQSTVLVLCMVGYVTAAVAVPSMPAAEPAPAHRYPLDPTAQARTFDGIGGLSAGASSRLLVSYPEPQRSQLLDALFTPGAGAGLQMLKVEIGGDGQSTDGTEPSHMHTATDLNYHRGYEWWLMTEAKRRNPSIKLYALPWTFPAWVSGGVQDPYTNVTATVFYIVKWLHGAKTVYGLDIDYIGIWNERAYNVTYIKTLRGALDKAGFASTLIVAPDDFGWSIAADILADPALAKAVHAIGSHYPGTLSTAQAVATNKPLWSSEDMSTNNDLRGAGCWARILNQNYVAGNMTSTTSWSLAASSYHGLQFFGTGLLTAAHPWAGHWDTRNNHVGLVYVTAHTTYFTEPGWRYLSVGSGSGMLASGGSYVVWYVALTNGTDLSVILEKSAWAHSQCIRPALPQYTVQPEAATFQLPKAWAGRTLYVWKTQLAWDGMNQTTASTYMQPAPRVTVNASGCVTLNVDVDAVYTVTTLQRAPLTPLPSSNAETGFPASYKDDFDSYPLSSEAAYFTDQTGSWEIVQANDTYHGRVMRQSVPQRPIVWSDDYKPYTVIGDVSWQDVAVSADVLVESATGGEAFLVARTRSCCDPRGVFFAIDATAHEWRLRTGAGEVVSRGDYPVAPDTWHRLSLSLVGNKANGSVDGTPVFVNEDVVTLSGFVGFGTGIVSPQPASGGSGADGVPPSYVLAQFDNFQLQSASPVACAPPFSQITISLSWCTPTSAAATRWDFVALDPVHSGGDAVAPGDSGSSPEVTVRTGQFVLQGSDPPQCLQVGLDDTPMLAQCEEGAHVEQFAVQTSSSDPSVMIGSAVWDVALATWDYAGLQVTYGNPSSTAPCTIACRPGSYSQHVTLVPVTAVVGGVHGARAAGGVQIQVPDGRCVSSGCEPPCPPLKLVRCDLQTPDLVFTYTANQELVSYQTGECLSLWGPTGPGVGMYKCVNQTNQQWIADATTATLRSAVPMASGAQRCLDSTCVAGGTKFMLSEDGSGHVTTYGGFETDHCLSTCDVTVEP